MFIAGRGGNNKYINFLGVCMIKTRHGVRDFGFRDKIGYLFGDFGNDFTFLLSSSFLLKFYTDVMGLAPWIVGAVMTLARFVDAFTDVTMGRICDRAKTWLLSVFGTTELTRPRRIIREKQDLSTHSIPTEY